MTLERRVEKLENGEWKAIKFSEIKDGDTFRLFDDGENPIETGKPIKAESDAFLGENNIYAVYAYVKEKNE